MPITKIQVEELQEMMKTAVVLDVRSPVEFKHAHIPGAISFPLFTDDERNRIGTAYKQQGREPAVRIGLESFGKNLLLMVDEAEKILSNRKNPAKEVVVHCWRGGMRSAAVAWLLDLYGFRIYLLSGGYKSYRRWVMSQFTKQYPIGIIGGYTGSNKTGVIAGLKGAGEYTIDLEALAGHKGSAFGNLERIEQPTQEQFENLLAQELFYYSCKDPNRTIWFENESQRIGNINVPPAFFNFFAVQPSYFINIPFSERLKHIVDDYGKASRESLVNAIIRIKKKLGGLEAKEAVALLMDDDVSGCFGILLNYYDRLYHKNEIKRKIDKTKVTYIECDTTDAKTNVQKILQHATSRK